MKSFFDFQNELSLNDIKNVYFISSSDSYFISKATEILRHKLFGDNNNVSDYFIRYADETPLNELAAILVSDSLFSSAKLVLVKRCEKYSKKIDEFISLFDNIHRDVKVMLVFDPEFVKDKKLDKNLSFYNFSDLPDSHAKDFVITEFSQRGISVSSDAAGMFLSLLPPNVDYIVSEVEKISNTEQVCKSMQLTEEVFSALYTYQSDESPQEIVEALILKDKKRALRHLQNLINNSVNEIYLLSVLSGYFTDILAEKSKPKGYRVSEKITGGNPWYQRGDFIRSVSSEISFQRIKNILSMILVTDKLLKSTNIDAGLLLFTLICNLTTLDD